MRGSVVFVFVLAIVSSCSVMRLFSLCVHKRVLPSWFLWMDPPGLTQLSHCIAVARRWQVAVRTYMVHGSHDGQAVVFRCCNRNYGISIFSFPLKKMFWR